MIKPIKLTDRRGFTIVELVIATAIFSVLLLIITQVIIRIGYIYQKGVTTTQVQDNTRTAADQIAEDIKLTKGAFVPSQTSPVTAAGHVNEYSFCKSSVRYTYAIGYKLGNGSETVGGTTYQFIPHVLWRDDYSNGGCPPVDLNNPTETSVAAGLPYAVGTNGQEMVSAGDRLTALCVGTDNGGSCTPATSSPYQITIEVVNGDYDLFNSLTPGAYSSSVQCQTTTGDQFCATAKIVTAAVPR